MTQSPSRGAHGSGPYWGYLRVSRPPAQLQQVDAQAGARAWFRVLDLNGLLRQEDGLVLVCVVWEPWGFL